MKKYLTFGVGLLAAVFLTACSDEMGMETKSSSNQPAQNAVGQIAVGQEAPDYKGKKVYLKFWASWCGPCKKSMPELIELAGKKDRDFEILSVIAPGIQGEKSETDFPKWFEEQGYKDVPVLYDSQATTFQAYQIRSIPTEILIDSQGKIGKIQFGAISNEDAEAAFKEMK